MKCITLDVWETSARLSTAVYRHFARCKDYGFKDQITRSGLSVPSNIAEGMEKDSVRENNRFLEIARVSLAEFMTQAYIGIEIDYIDRDQRNDCIHESEEILKRLIGLQKSLKSK